VQDFWERYGAAEPALFRQFITQQISREEYRLRRYADVLRDVCEQPEELAEELNRIYMREANHNIELFDEVKPFLANMQEQQVDVVILTNGPADGQRDKYGALQLSPLYTQHVYQ
jgi:FMN phosphatase YigB (HAD superfamily)